MEDDTPRSRYVGLLERLRGDVRVVGVVLTGSQAREGTATNHSDYDVVIVVRDESLVDLAGEVRRSAELDVSVTGLTAFRVHALSGSPFAWDRYSYVHCEIPLDTDGLIGSLVAEKASLTEPEAAALAPLVLDQFLNSIYRCLKNVRDGRELAARMDAAEAIRPMLGYVFALSRRVEPYNKYLEWELERFPLPIPDWDLTTTRRSIDALRRPSDAVAGARYAFAAIEATALEHGHGDVVASWGDDVELMRGTAST